MCLLVVKPKGVDLPKEKYLWNGKMKNQDGMGMAYWKAGTNIVKIKKDIEIFYDFWKFIQENITKEDAAMFHFRLATHGLKDAGNRHPFPLSKDKKELRNTNFEYPFAVAHNGVLTQYSDRTKELSDTQQFIEEILSDEIIKTNLNNPTIQILIDHYLSNDRLAILDNNGFFNTWGSWEKEGDILFSNGGYKDYPTSIHRACGFTNYNRHWEDDALERSKAVKSLPAPESKDFSKKKGKGKGRNADCPYCGKFKWLFPIFIKEKDEEVDMCKECRKIYKDNQMDLDALDLDDEETKSPCDSCKELFDAEELNDCMGFHICDDCIEASSLQEFLLKEEKIKDKKESKLLVEKYEENYNKINWDKEKKDLDEKEKGKNPAQENPIENKETENKNEKSSLITEETKTLG
jgi:predicted glutamine amidotransferase